VNDLSWYVSRSTGVVATLLAVAALVFGFFFSARNTGDRRRPAWWLDLHNWLGGLALAFTIVHIIATFLNENSGIGILQIIVPGTAPHEAWAISWGVIATYLLAITVFTSWPRKRLRPHVWRTVHLTSVVGVALAGLHAFQSGTDARDVLFEAGLVIAAAVGVYALSVRVLALVFRRRG
jgi:predicted ferric reductase